MIKKIMMIAVCAGAVNCSMLDSMAGGLAKPSFSFQKLDIKNITLSEITFNLLTSVKNPYPVSLPKSNLNMNLMIEGTTFLKDVKTDMGKVEAGSVKDLPFEFKLSYDQLQQLYKKFPSKELLDVKLDGIMGLPIPDKFQLAGKKSVDFPFAESRQVPAILPTVDIKNFQIMKPDTSKVMESAGSNQNLGQTAVGMLDKLLDGKPGTPSSAMSSALSGLDMNIDTQFDIALKNLAAAPLNFSDLKYDLTLKGEKFVSGVPDQIINQGKESTVKVKSSFPLKTLSAGLIDAIQKKNADFRLVGASGLKVPGLPDGILNFQYDKNGNFKW